MIMIKKPGFGKPTFLRMIAGGRDRLGRTNFNTFNKPAYQSYLLFKPIIQHLWEKMPTFESGINAL